MGRVLGFLIYYIYAALCYIFAQFYQIVSPKHSTGSLPQMDSGTLESCALHDCADLKLPVSCTRVSVSIRCCPGPASLVSGLGLLNTYVQGTAEWEWGAPHVTCRRLPQGLVSSCPLLSV